MATPARQAFGVDPRGLLLYTAHGVSDDDVGVRRRRRWRVEMSGELQPALGNVTSVLMLFLSSCITGRDSRRRGLPRPHGRLETLERATLTALETSVPPKMLHTRETL